MKVIDYVLRRKINAFLFELCCELSLLIAVKSLVLDLHN